MGEIQRVRINRNLWKSSLTKEIIHLEDNLDQIYYTVGLKPHRIVRDDDGDEAEMITDEKGITRPELRDYESIIDGQVDEISKAVDNICALISSVTEFDLPIPVLVLIKLANRMNATKCTDFKKKVPGTLAKKYIQNKRCISLITTSLKMYEWISKILSTNILPFQPYLNQNLLNLLAWTRTSNLIDHDSELYYELRVHILSIFTNMIEQLSVNFNLDAKQLSTLIEDELIEGLSQLVDSRRKPSVEQDATDMSSLRKQTTTNGIKRQTSEVDELEDCTENRYACEVIQCLDRIFLVYADFLEAKLEYKIKNFIVRTCIKIYRDFDQNLVGAACRRRLLYLLETISNRPYSSTTTEVAWHIFELCDRMETDPEIRYIAKRSIKQGLAHRPIIVSHFDVHDCYANKCDTEQSQDNATVAGSMQNGNSNGNTEVDIEPVLEHDIVPVSNSITARPVASVPELETPSEVSDAVQDQIDMDQTLLADSNPTVEMTKQAATESPEETQAVQVPVTNGLNESEKRMDEDRPDGDKVVSIANGSISERDKIASMRDERAGEQGDHKVDSAADKQVSERDKAGVSGSDEEEDELVKPYLDLFVDLLVTKAGPVEK